MLTRHRPGQGAWTPGHATTHALRVEDHHDRRWPVLEVVANLDQDWPTRATTPQGAGIVTSGVQPLTQSGVRGGQHWVCQHYIGANTSPDAGILPGRSESRPGAQDTSRGPRPEGRGQHGFCREWRAGGAGKHLGGSE